MSDNLDSQELLGGPKKERGNASSEWVVKVLTNQVNHRQDRSKKGRCGPLTLSLVPWLKPASLNVISLRQVDEIFFFSAFNLRCSVNPLIIQRLGRGWGRWGPFWVTTEET